MKKEKGVFKLHYYIKDGKTNRIFNREKIDLRAKTYSGSMFIALSIISNKLCILKNHEKISSEELIFIFCNSKKFAYSFENKEYNKSNLTKNIEDNLGEFYKCNIYYYPNIIHLMNLNKKKKIRKKRKYNKGLIESLKNVNELVFFDLEMNCGEDVSCEETISIGAVKTTNKGEVVKTYYSLVNPSVNKVLGDRCVEITGLNQEEISNAPEFVEVFKEFDKWCGDGNILFIAWGRNDPKTLKRDDKRLGGRLQIIDRIRGNYLDFQEVLCKQHLGLSNHLSLENALINYNKDFSGNKHNALDDSLNLMKLYFVSKLYEIN
ncbi:MAG: exonuclease domain-containing protein [Clostridium sp.]